MLLSASIAPMREPWSPLGDSRDASQHGFWGPQPQKRTDADPQGHVGALWVSTQTRVGTRPARAARTRGPGSHAPARRPACGAPRTSVQSAAGQRRAAPRKPGQPDPDPDGPFSQPQAVRATTFPLAKLIGITPEGSWKEGGLPVTRGQGDARPRSRGAAAASAPDCTRALATSFRFDFAL